jgi:NAD(P)-dependent dehydrogenase (short-subunit alcohol dehydrogenase family)
MNGKVVVITGALGALGKVVTEEALARGARVAAVDHAPSQISLRTGSGPGVDLSVRRKQRRRSTPRLRNLAGWMF